MKRFNPRSTYASILLGSVVLFAGCKKETSPILPPEQAASMVSVPSTCKPVVLGATVQYPGGQVRWETLMQKWYGGSGKLAYLKANFFSDMNNLTHLEHSIPWGELSYYNNNQVYLKNGSDTTMRVTLDAMQRPVASYYHHNHFPHGSFLVDTSYYHFTNTRLDSIINLSVRWYGGHSEFAKYKFYYDGYHNLVRVDRWDPRFNLTSMFLSYDYAQPVTDMVPVQQLTIPAKLLEYMDLLKFPVHHRLVQVTGFGNNWHYNNYSLLGSGLVSSYEAAGFNQRIFYTGWSCSSVAVSADDANRQKNSLNSLSDFKNLYPQQ